MDPLLQLAVQVALGLVAGLVAFLLGAVAVAILPIQIRYSPNPRWEDALTLVAIIGIGGGFPGWFILTLLQASNLIFGSAGTTLFIALLWRFKRAAGIGKRRN